MVNNIYIIYLKQTPAHSQGDDHGIETGKEVVSHAPPTAVDMLVNPTATERFGNVEDAEKDETQRGEGNDLPSGSLEKTYSQTGHPGAKRFVDDNGTGVFAPVSFHDVGSPDADDSSADNQAQSGQEKNCRRKHTPAAQPHNQS